MSDAAERKRQERERMRANGFVLVTEWIHRDDVERARKYLRRIRKKKDK
ncbi:hypothetical protein [Primorskyibacter sedentarius]